jgi:hypothetical protein
VLLAAFAPRARGHLAPGPDWRSRGWGRCHRAAPPTAGGARAVCTPMAARAQDGLGDLATSLDPRTVLGPRPDQRATCSREVQARVRSRPRAPWTTRAVCAGAGVGVYATGGLRARAR